MKDDLYQPAGSHRPGSVAPRRRWAHVVVAFLSAFFIPALLAYAVLVLWSASYEVVVRPGAVATTVLGAFASAALVYRHRRIPLWAASLVGVLVVLLLALAPSIWAAVIDRVAA